MDNATQKFDPDALLDRAYTLLRFLDLPEAAKVLMDAGVGTEDAFLAVQAAKILVEYGS